MLPRRLGFPNNREAMGVRIRLSVWDRIDKDRHMGWIGGKYVEAGAGLVGEWGEQAGGWMDG